MWSVLDIYEAIEPKRFFVYSQYAPVQTSSQGSSSIQDMERTPVFLGLPFWTPDELVLGYVFPANLISAHV